jgi:hypothetical protein
MFGHPMSKAGYVLAALAIIGAFSSSYVPYSVRSIVQPFIVLSSIFGFSAVFLGVIARGFERVEAAILSNKDRDER